MAYRHRVRNPIHQARIFLPKWFIKVVKPGKELANDTVQLHVPLDMGKIDIKNYLTKIYGIPVAKVHTRIQRGKFKYSQYGNDVILKKQPDIKIAYVFLSEGTFKFPEMFPDIDPKEVEDVEDSVEESQPEPAVGPIGSKKWFNI